MFDLLLVLVQNPGRVLGKEFLLQSVWPDSFVEEGNITFNVRQLRKALDDDAQAPSYIETVPRRGYRFVAEVEEIVEGQVVLPESDSETSAQDAGDAPRGSRRFLFPAIAGSLIILAAIGVGAWFILNQVSGA